MPTKMTSDKTVGLKLCIQCNGTMKYDDGFDCGLVACDRCFFGFEPEDGMCPSKLEPLSLEAIEALRIQALQNKGVR